jgi:hypothetical protein
MYVARCEEVRNHTRCTHEIPVTFKGREAFADPFTLILQSMAIPVSCQEDIPPRCKIEEKWFCGYPNATPCTEPPPEPVYTQVIEEVATRKKDMEWSHLKEAYHCKMAEKAYQNKEKGV